MGTEKRDRQRANREAKRAQERKIQRRTNLITRGRRILIWVVIALVALLILNLATNNSSSEALGVLAAL